MQGGFTGIRLVCWGNPLPGWVNCGMGAAVSNGVFATTIFNQISSVGIMAFKIATIGSDKAAEVGSKTSSLSSKFLEVASKVNEFKIFVDRNKDVIEKIKMGKEILEKTKKLYTTTNHVISPVDSEATLTDDAVRFAAEIAVFVDPSGAANVVAAYTYPKCSRRFS